MSRRVTGHTSFVSDDDSLVLEDESARMALKGNAMPLGPLVTGVVAAVRGVSAANGDFQVKVRSPLSFHPSYTVQGLKGNAMPLGPLFTGILAGACGVSAANGDFRVEVCSPTFVQVCSTYSRHNRQQRWFRTGIIQIWHLGTQCAQVTSGAARLMSDQNMLAQDALYSEVQPQQPLANAVEDKYVALKSGLGMSVIDPEESTHLAAGRLVLGITGPGAAA